MLSVARPPCVSVRCVSLVSLLRGGGLTRDADPRADASGGGGGNLLKWTLLWRGREAGRIHVFRDSVRVVRDSVRVVVGVTPDSCDLYIICYSSSLAARDSCDSDMDQCSTRDQCACPLLALLK